MRGCTETPPTFLEFAGRGVTPFPHFSNRDYLQFEVNPPPVVKTFTVGSRVSGPSDVRDSQNANHGAHIRIHKTEAVHFVEFHGKRLPP